MDRKRLAIIFAVVVVDMLSFSIVLPLLPYLADDLGATKVQISLLTAVYPLAQFVGAPLLGRLSDRFGRKPVLMASIAGTAIGFVVLATARSLPILFVSRFIDGITGGNISVAQAYIADITSREERGKALGMIGAAFGLGFVIGPVVGGILTGISYAAPAWLGAALAVVDVVLVAALLPESLSAEARARLAGKVRTWLDMSALGESLHHKRVGPLLSVRFLTGLSFAMFESGFALWAMSALRLSARANGLVLGYVGVLSVFIQAFLIGKLTKRWSDDALLLASLSVAAVSLAVWGFTGRMWLLLAVMPALSFGLAVTNTVMVSAITKAVHRDEVGGILGVVTSIQSLTRIPAAALPGALITYVGIWAPGVTAATLTAAAALVAFGLLCWRPGQQACVEDEAALRGD